MDGWLVAGLVTSGVGVVGLVVGTYFGLAAKGANDDSLGLCRTDIYCTAQGVELRETAQERATASTASFVVGGVLAGAGLAMVAGSLVTGADEATSSATLVPVVAPGSAGLWLEGRW